MKIQLETTRNSHIITSSHPDAISVDQEMLETSLIVTPTTLIRDWAPANFEELTAAHFEAVAELQPEIVVFGSGKEQRFPQPELIIPLIDRGIGIETMDTSAACRTYNVLVSEGRNVAAALIIG